MIKARPCAGDINAGKGFLTNIEPFIWRLTGKDTLYQMIALAEQVTLRAGATD